MKCRKTDYIAEKASLKQHIAGLENQLKEKMKKKEFNIEEWIATHDEYESIDEERHYGQREH